MILTEFPFGYFSDKPHFSKRWGGLLGSLSGERIEKIFGVWDRIDREWFGEAPMLVQTTKGTLAVNVKSEKYLALEWNTILPTDKTRWFSEKTIREMSDMDWSEDLEWRGYSPLDGFNNAKILRIEVIEAENALNGLRFETDIGCFSIIDNGDVIAGFPENDTEGQKMHKIRPMEEADLSECAGLIRRSFLTIAEEFGFTAEKDPKFTAFCVTEETLLHQLRNEHRPIFGCEADGVIAGYYSLKREDGEIELCNLCTAPEFRHRSIGSTLLEHSFDIARPLGFTELKICVVDANERVKKWYRSFGFESTGKYDPYYPFPCIFMTKNLKEDKL